MLNVDLKKFRERQRQIFPCLKLSALDVDEPELTPIQLPLSRMKLRQWPTLTPTIPADGDDQDSQAREVEIKLRCVEAESGILAVRAASLALSAVKKARHQDYRGQAGVTCSQRNLQKAELMKTFEITMYSNVRTALIHLGHMEKDADEPYQLLSHWDTRRKETHLHCAKGDSQLFNGTAWYLQSGVMISDAAVALSRGREQHSDDDEPQLLAGTQTLKHSGQADREEEQNGGLNGKVNFARMQAAMHRRLEHNAKVIFKSAESGAHHDWVSTTSFDELVTKIDAWRDVVFKWMDDMGIHSLVAGDLRVRARHAMDLPRPPVLENHVGGVLSVLVVAQSQR
ncbi:hypothetical protein B0H13DRAFT_2344565 [Mycena leptocephala]|nr:hypothetical protein B0H13DRAFT_2344565 [Mycena leptocephala]